MSRINPACPDLTEDSDLPSSPVAQPSQEVSDLVPVLPDVPFVQYIHIPPPSLNPPQRPSKKRPQAALNDFPPELVLYADQYKPSTYLSGPLMRMIAGIRSQAMLGFAAANDASNFLGRIHRLLYPSPPNMMTRNTMMKSMNSARTPLQNNSAMSAKMIMKTTNKHISIQLNCQLITLPYLVVSWTLELIGTYSTMKPG